MNSKLNKALSFLMTFLLFTNNIHASEAKNPSYDLNQLMLPSEVKDISKKSGSIFYNPSVKGKVLIPVHFWGEIRDPGLHFIPVDTTLVNGLSMAGGPTSLGELKSVRVTKKNNLGKIDHSTFDLETGGGAEAHRYTLGPGDTIFIKRSHFYENRSYYTGLVGVLATVLSSVLLC